MSTCKSGKWPSRVSNGNTAAPQAHPSRDVTELVEALTEPTEEQDRAAFIDWLATIDPRVFNPNAYWGHQYRWEAWKAHAALFKYKGAK